MAIQVYGPGGSGKTRLLQEVGKNLVGLSWRGGFLRQGIEFDELREVFESVDAPVFFVVDYAADRLYEVNTLLSAAAVARWEHPLLVLLAERYELTPGLDSLGRDDRERVDLEGWLASRGGLKIATHPLGELDPDTAAQIYSNASEALAGFAGYSAVNAPTEPPLWKRPLHIGIEALLSLSDGEKDIGGDENALLEEALNHERRRWQRHLQGSVTGQNLQRAIKALDLLAASALFADGLSREEFMTLWDREPFSAYADLREPVGGAAFSAFADPDGERLIPLEPDPVADVLLRQMEEKGNLEVLLRAVFEVLLVRLSVKSEEETSLLARLMNAAAVLDRSGAVEDEDEWRLLSPGGIVVASVLAELDVAFFKRVTQLLSEADPNYPLLIRPVHLILARAAILRAVDDNPEYARAIGGLSSILSALGRYQEALDQAQRTAELFKHLAQQNPDHFSSDLAMSLNNLATVLSTLGRHEEALEFVQRAAELYKHLAQQNPDHFSSDLAMSLNNLATVLSTLGRHEEALEFARRTAELYEQLAQQNPDRFLPNLAGSFINLATVLSSLGRHPEAFEKAKRAVRLYEQLAEQNPDAFLFNLARSLNNLANILSFLGQREEALELAQRAVQIHERLVEQNPAAFLPDLASSLDNWTNRLSDIGRYQEALDQAQRATGLFEQLAQQNPDRFLPDLAASLNNLAIRLSNLSRAQDALELDQRAVEIRERLAQQNPDRFLPDLAASLNNLANHLSNLGRYQEALEPAKRAVEIRERLAQQNPDRFLPDLAASLNNLANRFFDLGRVHDALELAKRAVEIRERLAQQNPNYFLPDLAASLGLKSHIFLKLRLYPGAFTTAQKGTAALREHFLRIPAAYGALMSALLIDYLASASQLERLPEPDLVCPLLQAKEALSHEVVEALEEICGDGA